MRRALKAFGFLGVGLGLLVVAAMPAKATLIGEGLTYTLTLISAPGATESFELKITGINQPGVDAECCGRFGVQSFSFTTPPNFITATPPGGFSLVSGGLNSNGCDMKGAFFCFSGPTPSGPPLAANSTLTFDFSITASSAADFLPTNWDYHFKINWVGTQNNYNLLSTSLFPGTTLREEVPEPATLTLLGLALVGLGFMVRRKAS
jgi:hypothetical protein